MPEPTRPVYLYGEYVANQPMARRVRDLARDATVFALALGRSIGTGNGQIRFPFYHHVFDDERSGFIRQLDYMRRYGEFIDLGSAVEMLESGKPIDGTYFCVTFDDGFKNCRTNGLAILVEKDVPAAFFLATRYIGTRPETDWDVLRGFYGGGGPVVELLDWDDCRTMIAAGMTIGSHTVNHVRLVDLDDEEAAKEFAGSKRAIEAETDQACVHFCCPWGRPGVHFDTERDPELARRAGYRSFLTTVRGGNSAGDSPMAVRHDHLLAGWGTYQLRYFLGGCEVCVTRQPPCPLRSATDQDAPAVFGLLAGLGLRLPSTNADRAALWRRLWIDNPALQSDTRPSPGWVLEADGTIVGFFGSIPRQGVVAGRSVRIAVASLWGVQPAYRGHVPQLADAYFEQDWAEISLVTAAVPATARILERHAGHAVPQPSLGRSVSWVIDTQGFIAAALRRKGIRGAVATFAGRVARKSKAFARGRLRIDPATLPSVAILSVADVGGEFDGFWRRLAGTSAGLIGVRDSATLRWHYQGNDSAVILALRGGKGLDGYAVVVRDDAPAIGLRRLRIADLVVGDDDAAKTTALLAAAFAHGDAECCHVLEIAGLVGYAHRHAMALRPLVRSLPSWPAYYRAADPLLAVTLAKEGAWSLTGFDGDTTLI